MPLFLEFDLAVRVWLLEYRWDSCVIHPTNRLVELVDVPFFEKMGVTLFHALRIIAGDLILMPFSLSHLIELILTICFVSLALLGGWSFFDLCSLFRLGLEPMSLSYLIVYSTLFNDSTFESIFSYPVIALLRSPNLGHFLLDSSVTIPRTYVAISCWGVEKDRQKSPFQSLLSTNSSLFLISLNSWSTISFISLSISSVVTSSVSDVASGVDSISILDSFWTCPSYSV